MQEIDIIKEQEVTSISNQASVLTISNAAEYSSAADYLKTVKSALKKVNDEIIAPAEEVKRKAELNRKNLVNLFRVPLQKAESILKRKLLFFDQEAKRKAREEQDRLQANADAEAERKRERLINQATRLKTPELQEQRLAEAEEVEATVITVQSEAPKVEGISTRKTWKAEVVGKLAFLKAAAESQSDSYPNPYFGFIIIDESALNKVAAATKGQISYPGIKFYEHETMAAGGN